MNTLNICCHPRDKGCVIFYCKKYKTCSCVKNCFGYIFENCWSVTCLCNIDSPPCIVICVKFDVIEGTLDWLTQESSKSHFWAYWLIVQPKSGYLFVNKVLIPQCTNERTSCIWFVRSKTKNSIQLVHTSFLCNFEELKVRNTQCAIC